MSNKRQIKYSTSLTHSFLCLFLLLFLISCGVESTGDTDQNDPESIVIHGTLLLSSGAPAANFSVKAVDFNTEVTVSSDGSFELTLPGVVPSLLLTIDSEQSSATLEWSLPEKTSQTYVVTIKLSVDKDSATILSTPHPTSTPTEHSGPFNEQGDTTQFGIPHGLTGNAHRGKRKYLSTCASCHSDIRGRNYSYSRLKQTVEGSPMFLKIPAKDIADLIAYLNFRNQ